jgi:uncharacterized Tic20 family protein
MSAPGWYPDPGAPAQQRWWDGGRWTEHTAPGAARAVTGPPVPRPPMSPESARQWGMLAHLSAFAGLIVGFSFLGPLVVYLIKKDEDAFVADQAREALNFNLSALLYFAVASVLTFVLLLVIVGLLFIPLLLAMGVAWVVLVIVAAVAANRGQAYRYPLTIRFVS